MEKTGCCSYYDVQNERSLGTNLFQLNEKENRGAAHLKKYFLKKINCQLENIIIYNIISFFKTLKVS